MNKYIPYTGLGSEMAPKSILDTLSELGYLLAISGRTLRSGSYKGCSSAFESGVNKAFRDGLVGSRPITPKANIGEYPLREIFLPYRGYEGHQDDAYYEYDHALKSRIVGFIKNSKLGERFDKVQNPYLMKDYIVRVYQLLGIKLNQPSKFMVCWSPDGARTSKEVDFDSGHISISICLSEILNIQVFNLNNGLDNEKILEWMSKIKSEIRG